MPLGALRQRFPKAMAVIRATFDGRRQAWRKYPREIDPELKPLLETERDDGSKAKVTWWVMSRA